MIFRFAPPYTESRSELQSPIHQRHRIDGRTTLIYYNRTKPQLHSWYQCQLYWLLLSIRFNAYIFCTSPVSKQKNSFHQLFSLDFLFASSSTPLQPLFKPAKIILITRHSKFTPLFLFSPCIKLFPFTSSDNIIWGKTVNRSGRQRGKKKFKRKNSWRFIFRNFLSHPFNVFI